MNLRSTVKASCLCALLSVSNFAQTANARLEGTVQDSSGAVVPGVKVITVNTNSQARAEVTADTGGSFVFPTLQPGKYTLTVEAIGFRTAVSSTGKHAVLHGGTGYGAYVTELSTGRRVQTFRSKIRPVDAFRFGWSPDGRSISWSAERLAEDQNEIEVVDRVLNVPQLRMGRAEKSTDLIGQRQFLERIIRK